MTFSCGLLTAFAIGTLYGTHMSSSLDWLNDHTFTIVPQFSLTSQRSQVTDPEYVLPDVLVGT